MSSARRLICPKASTNYDDAVYDLGCKRLYEMIDEGIMAQDEKPHFYIYRQIMKGRSCRQVLVATVSVDEYLSNRD